MKPKQKGMFLKLPDILVFIERPSPSGIIDSRRERISQL